MANHIKYITKEGDTWTLIAHRAYGDATKCVDILKANPNVAATDTLPANITIFVPVQEVSSNTVNTSDLPPWKRK